MLRLIEANLAATGKPHLGNGTPPCFLNLGALNALLRKRSHLCFQAIAHEIEFMRTIFNGRVERSFSRRQSEDQPAMAGINGFEAEDIGGKCAVRFGVFAVDNYVSAKNHLPLQKIRGRLSSLHAPWNFENSTKIKLGRYPATAALIRRLPLSAPGRRGCQSGGLRRIGRRARR